MYIERKENKFIRVCTLCTYTERYLFNILLLDRQNMFSLLLGEDKVNLYVYVISF